MVEQQLGTRARAPQGCRVTDSLLVRGPSQRELQGQAAEGRAGNLSLRIELTPAPPPSASLSSISERCSSEGDDRCFLSASGLGKEEVAFHSDADQVEVGDTCTW